MKREDRASDLFLKGYSCSQAVFASFSEELGLDPEWALRIAAPFRGGMGRMGRTCGAVTGAFMALGLRFGNVSPGDNEKKEEVIRLVREFDREFTLRNGSCICNELLGCDISDPEQWAKAAQDGLFFTLCPKLVRDAVEIAGRMIDQEQAIPRKEEG